MTPAEKSNTPYAEVWLTREQAAMVHDALVLNPDAEFVLLQHDGPSQTPYNALRPVWVTPAGAKPVLVDESGGWQ